MRIAAGMTEITDPYVYPGTDVLRNTVGLMDPDDAFRFERNMSFARRRQLEINPVQGGFDLRHLCRIHRQLYQDVWDWAGQIRTVEISKGSSQFHPHTLIRLAFAGEVEKFLASSALLSNPHVNDDAFVHDAAELLSMVNYIHAFREGNGRTQRAYIDQIAGLSGRRLTWRNVSRLDNEQASIRAFNSATGAPLEPMLSAALEPPAAGSAVLGGEI